MTVDLIIVFIYSYLLGSIPFGLIIIKFFLKNDIRKIGSGNIGATNVLRTGKKTLAVLTLLLDATKGYLSIFIAITYYNELVYLAGLACFIGHIFPLWLKFKGGKGVATYLGIIFALSFKFGLIFGLTWLLLLSIFKYSSLSSVCATLMVFLYSLILNNHSLNIYLFITLVMILVTHKENVKRLKNGTENKIKI